MKAALITALEAVTAQAVNVFLAVIFVAVWLGLGAYLDGKPSETDALQASAAVSNDLAAEYAASKDAP